MGVTPTRSYDTAVEPHALVDRVQIVDANGNVLSSTTAPLPSGAATAAKQDLAKTVLDNLLTELAQKLEPADLAALATEAKLEAVRLLLAGTLSTAVSNFPATQAVSVANPTTNPETGGVLVQDPSLRRELQEIQLLLIEQTTLLREKAGRL